MAHWKAILIAAPLLLIPFAETVGSERRINCEQPEDKIVERACTVPEIMTLIDEFRAAWKRNVRPLTGEAAISIKEDSRTAYAHLLQRCWYWPVPKLSNDAVDTCIVNYLRFKVEVLNTKIATLLPDGYGTIVTREFGWAMPSTDEGGNRIVPPGIKSQGIIFYPQLTDPRFTKLLDMPDDTGAVIDTSRSVEADFDILDLKPENLTFRYRYRQETLSGEMRAWETLKTLDLTRVGK